MVIPNNVTTVAFWEPSGAGVQRQLDASTLLESYSLSFDAMQEQGTVSRSELLCTRHEPNGRSVFTLDRNGVARRYGFGAEQHGEVSTTLHCTSARMFSDLRWHPEGRDWVVTSEGEEIETGISHTEWPNVSALSAAMDDSRIVAVGTKELRVFDRTEGKEALRLKFGPSYAAALMPEGRFLAVRFGKGAKLAVFEPDGTVLAEFATIGTWVRVSPNGRIAHVRNDELYIFDPMIPRLVYVADNVLMADWIDETTLAVARANPMRMAVVDLADSVATGTVFKVKKPKANAR